jgi:hypothetical protein
MDVGTGVLVAVDFAAATAGAARSAEIRADGVLDPCGAIGVEVAEGFIATLAACAVAGVWRGDGATNRLTKTSPPAMTTKLNIPKMPATLPDNLRRPGVAGFANSCSFFLAVDCTFCRSG